MATVNNPIVVVLDWSDGFEDSKLTMCACGAHRSVLGVLCPSVVIFLVVQLVSPEANDAKTAGVGLEMIMFSVCETDCGKDN